MGLLLIFQVFGHKLAWEPDESAGLIFYLLWQIECLAKLPLRQISTRPGPYGADHKCLSNTELIRYRDWQRSVIGPSHFFSCNDSSYWLLIKLLLVSRFVQSHGNLIVVSDCPALITSILRFCYSRFTWVLVQLWFLTKCKLSEGSSLLIE